MRFGVGKWAGVAVVAALVCAAPTAARATDGHDDDRGPNGPHVEWPAVLVAPSDLQVTDTKKNAVRVSWSRDDGGLDHVRYRVYSNGVLQLTTDDDHATVSGLDCATSYAIGVASVDASGHTSATSTVLTGTDSCTGGLRIVLSAPQYIDPGALLRADTNGDSKSVSFGYCPGATCSWASATTIGTVRGDDDTQLRWRTLPSDGRYTLLAHAVDQRGRSADSAPITVTVDGTPPHTTITSGPAPFVNTTSVSFTFGASEPVSGFECSLDNSHFAACGATLSLTGLEAGAHALSVRSIDLAGNVDPTPPSLTWTIDRTAPKTTIVSGPPTRTTSTTASFALSANEPSTFGCSLDGGSFTACTAAPVFNGLGVGTHRFVARAIDRAGNVDPSPPAWSWTIDPPAGPVQVTITSAPSGTVASRSATVSFSSNYAGATFECALDASAYVVCASPASLTSLSDGPHAFLVRAVAIDGTRSTPASASWVVDTTGPAVTLSPSRPPESSGWYRSSVTFTTTGSDAGGVVSCTPPQTYSGPDASRVTITGTCVDAVGNTGTATAIVSYDATSPSVTLSPSRSADSNGWYNHALSFVATATDATSGSPVCVSPSPYAGPDGAHVTVSASCTDAAGNVGTASLSFAYDATAPAVVAAPSRASDHGEWYNAPFSVSFSATDTMSGGVHCDAPVSFGGPDGSALSVSGSCSDAAGNSRSATFAFKYDATAPTVSASPDRAPDRNGWFNHSVTVSFAGVDSTSGGVTCDAPKSYSAPDSATASLSGNCTDAAGNVASASFSFKYDATAPTVNASPDRPADHNGWYNHPLTVSFAGSDTSSGGLVCDPAVGYHTDSASALVAGTCMDAAGNVGTGTFGFSYDATAPSVTASTDRAADHNGWFNHPVTVSFTATDALSGVTCDPAVTYHADSVAANVSGSCSDGAGNTAGSSVSLEYDATPPSVTASPSRPADVNGWYNHPLSVSFAGTDATSGGVVCDAPVGYGTDAGAASIGGSCTDAAGNSASAHVALRYDATAPSVTATPSRPADANGWYNHALQVSFSGSDALSGGVQCDSPVTYGTDAAAATITGSCTDAAGNTGAGPFSLKYDGSAPHVTPAADRAPDHNGWYNHPLSVSFSATDDLSGEVVCAPAVLYATDDVAASVSGSCIDAAGNQASASLSLKYDSTAPSVTASPDRSPDSNGWFNHPLLVSFVGSDSTSGGVSCDPAASYSTDSAAGHVSGSCTDAAGNTGSASLSLQYDATAPSVTANAGRPADSNGWYNHPLSVSFSGSDPLSGGVTCDPAVSYSTDAATAHVSGSCTDAAGNSGSDSLALKYDSTAPSVTAAAGRSADRNGWYNHPLSVSFSGTDALSGGVSCDPGVSYSTDSASAHVSGSCTDAAGNSGSDSLALKYDGTAPLVTAAAGRPADSNGWYNHPL